jgi:hypothetical protein
VERVEISEIEMRNKTVVTIGVAAMLAFTGFLYQRTRAESTTFEVLDAGYELKSCSDLGPSATAGLPVSANACGR